MEKLFSKIKKETLTTDEKSQMILNLNKYIESNPVEDVSFKKPIKSPFYSTVWTLSKQRTVVLPVTAALIFVLTSGTVLASNSSLPGDTLYPIKKFNESVQSVVAIGTKAKTKVSTEHAISRLEEAVELASRGDLTQDRVSEIEDDFLKQLEKIEKNIEKLKNEGDGDNADKLQSVFEETVSLQGDDFDKLAENKDVNDDNKENLKKIKARLEKDIIKKKKDRKIEKEQEEKYKDKEVKKEDDLKDNKEDEEDEDGEEDSSRNRKDSDD